MQINVVEGGSPELFTAMVFPQASMEVKSWLTDQWAHTSSMLTDVGRRYAQEAHDLYTSLQDTQLYKKARAILGKIGGSNADTLYEIKDIDGMREASVYMQRYMMAMPQIRAIYHEQLCDGYSGSYVDMHPLDVEEEHYDYRRVMSGIVREKKDRDGNTILGYTCYPDELLEGDRELDSGEKFAILETWDNMLLQMQRGLDPTDTLCGNLGRKL